MSARVLVVDDDPDLLSAFARMLAAEELAVDTASSAAEALAAMEKNSFDLLLTDMSMPKMDGLELLMRLRQRGDHTPAIVISGAGTIEHAVKALKLGALDFVEKPIQRQRLLLTVKNALRYTELREQHVRLQDAHEGERPMIGKSRALTQLSQLIAKVAPSDGRVLITGENGTGKELVAAAIHARSARRAGPFVKLNCGAVAENLVESELFGHEKGAFTGAIAARKGRFELADRGTLFLDEIGDMPMPMQVKLLRVLQEGQIERVGSTRTIEVDVRVLAATHRNLAERVQNGTFREDLFYRLNVVTLHVPPLRERKEDLPELVAHLCAPGKKGHGVELTQAALDALASYDFPGNVRELENVMERLAILYGGERVGEAELRSMLDPRARKHGAAADSTTETKARSALYQPGKTLRELSTEAERAIVLEALAEHGHSKPATAAALGMDVSYFYKKCRQLGIDGAGD